MRSLWVRRQRHLRTADRSRGAVLVEAMIVAPFFFGLLGIIVEGSLLVSSTVTLADSTRDAARTASIARDDGSADASVVLSITDNVSPLVGELERIVVFAADAPSAAPTVACQQGTASVADRCNVYEGAALANPLATTGCTTSSLDRFYCPSTRTSGEHIGVWVRFEQALITGLAGSFHTRQASSVQVVEPDQ